MLRGNFDYLLVYRFLQEIASGKASTAKSKKNVYNAENRLRLRVCRRYAIIGYGMK